MDSRNWSWLHTNPVSLISCTLSEPMGEGFFACFHIERLIIDLISCLISVLALKYLIKKNHLSLDTINLVC